MVSINILLYQNQKFHYNMLIVPGFGFQAQVVSNQGEVQLTYIKACVFYF